MTVTTMASVRSAFPGAQTQIYLDSASIGLLASGTRAAAEAVLSEHEHRGGAAKAHWMAGVSRSRSSIARLIGGTAEHVAFTQNTSTGIALVANGIDWQVGDNIVLPAGEFPSNSYAWRMLRRHGVEIRELPMRQGRAEPGDLAALIDSRSRVVAVSAVQYSSGHRYELAAFAEQCRRFDAVLVVDGTQAVGAMQINVEESDIDVLAVSGHKWLLAPFGIGFVHFSNRAMAALHPSTVGWRSVQDPFAFTHEAVLAADARRFESGTENLAGIAGLEASIGRLLELGTSAVERRVLALADALSEALRRTGLLVHRDVNDPRRSGIVMTSTERDDQALHGVLLDRGVRCALRGGIRFSTHIFTSDEDIAAAAAIVEESLA